MSILPVFLLFCFLFFHPRLDLPIFLTPHPCISTECTPLCCFPFFSSLVTCDLKAFLMVLCLVGIVKQNASEPAGDRARTPGATRKMTKPPRSSPLRILIPDSYRKKSEKAQLMYFFFFFESYEYI